MPDIKRIEREMRQCAKDVDSGIKLSTVGDSLLHLKGCFNGPPDTPYQGGTFMVDIKIPDGYPFSPPLMKFDTLIYHPNISSQTGAICLDILKDQWTPVLTMKTALISLASLLYDAVPNDPQDAVVARHYLTDRAGFDQTAREWTQKYACNLEKLVEMGFSRDDVEIVLRTTQIESAAIEQLLNM